MSEKEIVKVEAGQFLGVKLDSLMVDVTKEQRIDGIKYGLSTGENLKDKSVRRGYYNTSEHNVFMMLTTINMLLNGERGIDGKRTKPVWELWTDSKIMTPAQKKNIKMASTYFGKFVNDVFNNNLDITTKQKILKQLTKYDFRLIDDYTVKQIYNLMKSSTKEFKVEHDMFLDLVEAKMEMTCKGCTKDRNECKLREFFEEKFVPGINEGEECNCEYSY